MMINFVNYDNNGRLFILEQTGDRILEVDGVCVRSAQHDKAVQLIKAAGEKVTLTVQSLVAWVSCRFIFIGTLAKEYLHISFVHFLFIIYLIWDYYFESSLILKAQMFVVVLIGYFSS